MHKVAVYGSLRAGFGNHRLLSQAKFLKEAVAQGFEMVDLGAFPAVYPEEASAVKVEVYEVDDETLQNLDFLEGHPRFYRREEVVVDKEEVFMYVMQDQRYREHRKVASGDWKEFKNTGS